MLLIENSTDIEAMQLQSQGSCSSNDHPHAAKKRKTLGSLFKDNEEERDEMPVISKEQCINNEVDDYISSLRLDFEEDPLSYWKDAHKTYPYLSNLAKKFSAFVQQAPPQNVYSVHQAIL